ncbi:MAG TPA: choice-of-anchor tandem repeat NxxGxxAF-containing protein [Myxococcaceae bacterium]|nr:choice-of-anchor tandem repeat NxxGxxAF-containing protein [Myxococcaceae bacterium]
MRSSVHSLVALSCFARCIALLASIAAQCTSVHVHAAELVPALTDLAPLDLPTTFGSAGTFNIAADLNQAGDYVFATRGQSAVFLRPAGAAAPLRVVQQGDEVPGYPGSRMDIVAGMRINNTGLIVFRLGFSVITGESQGAILAYDGSAVTTVAFGGDPAPGTGGARYGSGFTLTGLNDAGDVAFVAPVEVPGVFSNRTTLYLAPSGCEPARIAGLGDPAPGTAGTFGPITGMALNSRGEILFSASIVGGAGGVGLFVGSTAGVRKVVANGDPNPLGGSFAITFSSANVQLNDAGQTSFALAGSLFLHDPDAGLTVAVQQGSAAPPALGGTFQGFATFAAHALNNSGEIAFSSSIVGSAITNLGVFRFRAGGSVEIVAYRNQVAPGAGGEVFTNFGSFSMNAGGQVSFRGILSGAIRNGVYRQVATDLAEPVALDSDAAPVPGGGTFYLSYAEPLRTLEDGSTYFFADVFNGAPFGEFLAGPSGIRALVSSGEPLPEGSRVVFRTFKVGAAGDYLAFLAHRPGGLISLMVHNLATGETTKVITDGDVLPGTGGAHHRLFSPNKVHVNVNGTVAFAAIVAGGTVDSGFGLFLWNQDSGVTKVVVPGDVDPSTGARFDVPFINQITPSPLNAAGQVVFTANLVGRPFPSGIFVGSANAPPQAVALGGDPDPTGGIFLAFVGQQNLNDAGQVSFAAITTSTGRTTIFLGGPGVAPRKVVGEGDAGPGGSSFSLLPTTMSLNDNGEIGLMANLSGASSGGVFIGRGSASPEVVALNGDASPDGSFYSGFAARADVVINNRGDLAFRADLAGGSSNSGYFLRRAGGIVQPVALEGQAAPGSDGRFATIPSQLVGLLASGMILRQSGDFACSAPVIQDGFLRTGQWRLRTDNSFEKILIAGDPAPGSGDGIASIPFFGANDGGQGPLSVDVGIVGGDFSEIIYVVAD